MKLFILLLNIFVLCCGFSKDYFEDYEAEGNGETNEMANYLLHTQSQEPEKINIELYYETFCPFSIMFYTDELYPTVLKMGEYLNVKFYPYGNAKTVKKNGRLKFSCQHGPKECYGNMLHACAIDVMGSKVGFQFNYCLMLHKSIDEFVDKCAREMSLDVIKTKQCAKGDKGMKLLKKYGDKSKKAGFHSVPYVLINGKQLKWNGTNFMDDVCAAFKQTPEACK